MAEKRKRKKRSWIRNLLVLAIFLIGLGILFYPTISDLWNTYRQSQLISRYTKTVQTMESEDYSELWKEAREYNEQHKVNTIVDAFDEETDDYVLGHPYDEILNPLGNGIMGYLEIPKINLRLAIYHGIGAEALENGCGHIEGTSLPIGGAGTHAALSAHRGLPSAKLFTDLDQITEGDKFYISILDETLAYEVDQILTVLPEETEDLAIEEGKDLVTLVTCTPYGVNTHRLLVRGVRTEYVEEEAREEGAGMILRNPMEGANRTERLLIGGLLVFAVSAVLIGVGMKISDWRKRKKKAKKDQDEHRS